MYRGYDHIYSFNAHHTQKFALKTTVIEALYTEI